MWRVMAGVCVLAAAVSTLVAGCGGGSEPTIGVGPMPQDSATVSEPPLAASPDPVATPIPSATPSTKRAEPAGCRYLSDDKLDDAVAHTSGGGGAIGYWIDGNATSCTYTLLARPADPTAGQAYVELDWDKGARVDQGTRNLPRVGGLGAPAYWFDDIGELTVQRPRGVVTITVNASPQFILDTKAIAVGAYRAAHLP